MKQKISLLKSYSVFIGGFLLAFLFFLNEACLAKGIVIPNFKPPKEEDVIWMESVSIENLKINFLKQTKPKKIVGRVISENKLINIKEIYYTIKSPTGAVFWETTETDVEYDELGGILFDFSLGEVRLIKGSVLVVDILNKRGALIASGEQEVAVQLFFSDPEISDLGIEIKKEKGVASFNLSNLRDDIVSVWPRIEIYNLDETELISEVTGSFAGVGTDGKQDFSIEFDLPEEPQVYVLKASVKAKDGRKLGGSLKKRFLVKGIFAHIKSFELLDEGVGAKSVNFVFTGVTKPNLKLEAKVKVTQEWEGAVVDKYQETLSIESDKRGRFMGSASFELENDVDYFISDVFITRNDRVIGKGHLEKKLVIAPNLEEMIRQQQEARELEAKIEKAKWWMRKDVLVWSVTLFILILIATNNWLRIHKKHLWILLCSVLFYQSVLGYGGAELGTTPVVWWRHSVESWFYNPSPDITSVPSVGFEHYSKLRMNGEILDLLTLDSNPLFANPAPDTKPTAILINFKKISPAHDDWFGIDVGDSSGNQDFDPEKEPTSEYDYSAVHRSVEFAFEVDIKELSYETLVHDTPSRETLQTFLGHDDGDWEYTTYFCMNGTTLNDLNCGGGQWYGASERTLKIDSTPPIVDFDNQVLHAGAAGTFETELRGKIEGVQEGVVDGRDEYVIDKRQKQISKNEKIVIIIAEEGERDEKKRQRIDVQRQIVIINARLVKVNQDLADSYLPDPSAERTALVVEKTNLENLLANRIIKRGVLVTRIIELEGNDGTDTTDGTGGSIAVLAAQLLTLTGEISTANAAIVALNLEILALKVSIETIKDESKTDPVSLAIACDDDSVLDGSDCRALSYDVQVRGNFCDNADICDETATRRFKICDQVGNCVDTEENNIDWYDPVIPETSITMRKDHNGDGELSADFSGTMKADNLMGFELSAATTDLRRRSNMPNPEDDSTVGTSLGFDYNTNACGAEANHAFFEETVSERCLESMSVCANSATERGEQEVYLGGAAACNSLCDPGFIYDDGVCYLDCDQRNLSLCLPGILGRGENCGPLDDDFEDWSPLPEDKQLGVFFTQTNTCGYQRQVLGTSTDVCSDINVFDCAPFNGNASFQCDDGFHYDNGNCVAD